MGVWYYISGTAVSLKRKASDLTSAVKVNAGDVLSQHWPTEETRSKIVPFAVNVAKYSAQEALNFIPGGVVAYKVVKRALEDVNKSKDLPGEEKKSADINEDVNKSKDLPAEEKKSADINQDGPLGSVHSDTTSDE